MPAFALQVVLRSSGESLSRLKHLLAAFHHDVEECLISQTRYTRSAFHPPELVGCPRTVRYHEELVRAEGHTRWRRWVAVPRRLRSRLRSRLDLRVRPHVLTAQAFRSPLDLSKTRVDARVPWGSKLPLLGDALAHDLMWLITEERRLPPTSPRPPPDLALISP